MKPLATILLTLILAIPITAEQIYNLRQRVLYYDADTLVHMEEEVAPTSQEFYEFSFSMGNKFLKQHDGKFWHVYYDDSEGDRNVYLRSSADGITWTSNVKVSDDAAAFEQRDANLAFHGSGSNTNVFVAYWDRRDDEEQLRIAVSTDAGLTFNPSTLIVSHDTLYSHVYTDIAVADDGTLYAAYVNRLAEDGTNNGVYFIKSSDNGASWSDPVHHAGYDHMGLWVQIEAGETGQVMVLRIEGDHNSTDILSFSSDDYGETWTQEAFVIDNGQFRYAGLVSLATGPDASVHAVWMDHSHINGEGWYQYANSHDWGQSWSEPVYASDTDDWLDLYGHWAGAPAITVSESGAIYAAWADRRFNSAWDNKDIYITRSTDGGLTWTVDFRVNEDPNPRLQRTPSVAVKSDGVNDTVLVIWAEGYEITGLDEPIDHAPAEFVLYQNYPNPFNPSTVIGLQLAVGSDIELTIYDVAGRKVRELVSGFAGVGLHEVVWDGTNDTGEPVSSGIYFYRLQTQDIVESKKMILLP